MAKYDPERTMKLADRAARLAELKDSVAWAELRAIVEERKAHQFGLLTRDLIAGSQVDQRHIDRMAGYFRGMEDLLDHPDLVESKLKSALAKAELLGDKEVVSVS